MSFVPFKIVALGIQTNLFKVCFGFSKPIQPFSFFLFATCLYLNHFLCFPQSHIISLWKSLAQLVILP